MRPIVVYVKSFRGDMFRHLEYDCFRVVAPKELRFEGTYSWLSSYFKKHAPNGIDPTPIFVPLDEWIKTPEKVTI